MASRSDAISACLMYAMGVLLRKPKLDELPVAASTLMLNSTPVSARPAHWKARSRARVFGDMSRSSTCRHDVPHGLSVEHRDGAPRPLRVHRDEPRFFLTSCHPASLRQSDLGPIRNIRTVHTCPSKTAPPF